MVDAVVLERLPLLSGKAYQDDARYQHKRVYIFLTRQGLIFILMLAVMLLGAVNYNNSMAYILCFLLTSLLFICILHTYRNLSGLILGIPESRPVYAGDSAGIPLLFENRANTSRVAILLESAPRRNNKQLRSRMRPQPRYVNITGKGIQKEDITFTALRRGVFIPGRFRLSSTYPLGLCVAWSYIEINRNFIVYPEPAGDARLAYLEAYAAQEQPGIQAGTDDFTGHRPYHNRDSVRAVDWKKYASEQGLLIKRFSGSGARILRFIWQQTSSETATEAQLSQLCLWIIEAEKHGICYGLELPGTSIDIHLGPDHKRRCLTALAAYGNDSIPD
jgi:uncharacterized protein (DUF58 family)